MVQLLRFLITVYQKTLCRLLPSGLCRFHPSCSHYASEALAVHGAARGLWLTVRRLARCQPFHPGGYDPVPPRTDARRTQVHP